jgi:hypothetical protein
MIDSKAILKQLHTARDFAAKELARLEATIKAFGGSVSSGRTAVTKRRLSAKARKAISEAQKKRHAKARAAKAKRNKLHPAQS